MKLELKQQHLQQLFKQRNFAYCVSGVLLLVNLLLVVKVSTMDEHWVLIPQFDTEARAYVSSSSYSDEYLISWADSVLRDLLTANPASIDQKVARFLQIAVGSYGDLKDKLKKIKDEQVATVFYPKKFKVEQANSKVLVTGEFLTFFGKDRVPVTQTKNFVLSYKRGANGVILVAGLEEVC